MSRRIVGVLRKVAARACITAVACLGMVGCVEPYDGSQLNLLLSKGIHIPGDTAEGEDAQGRPPSGTHYAIYVEKEGRSYHVIDFKVAAVLDRGNPCYVEDELAEYPYTWDSATGLHCTKWYDKLLEIYEQEDITDDEAGALYDAQVRLQTQAAFEDGIKALVGTHEYPQAEIDTALASIPSKDSMDDATNAARWEACQAFFQEYPKYYVGADRLMSLPLNGLYYGVVETTDPRNDGWIGGASMRTPVVIDDFDNMHIRWAFDDPNDPRIPAYEAELGPATQGYHYMAGQAVHRVRDVISVSLENGIYPSVYGEVAVYPNLKSDDVEF